MINCVTNLANITHIHMLLLLFEVFNPPPRVCPVTSYQFYPSHRIQGPKKTPWPPTPPPTPNVQSEHLQVRSGGEFCCLLRCVIQQRERTFPMASGYPNQSPGELQRQSSDLDVSQAVLIDFRRTDVGVCERRRCSCICCVLETLCGKLEG